MQMQCPNSYLELYQVAKMEFSELKEQWLNGKKEFK